MTTNSEVGASVARVIGMIGGMSQESTREYYDRIVRTYRDRYHDNNCPAMVIYSVQFQPLIDLIRLGRWEQVAERLGTVARTLQEAGADFLILATVTMHRIVDSIQSHTIIPILSLVDVTADAIVARGIHSVGLLGTRFTMEQPFFREELMQHGLRVLTPGSDERIELHRILSEELPAGYVRQASREKVVSMIDRLEGQGAEGVIRGGAQLPVLIHQHDVALPLFETTALHVEAT